MTRHGVMFAALLLAGGAACGDADDPAGSGSPGAGGAGNGAGAGGIGNGGLGSGGQGAGAQGGESPGGAPGYVPLVAEDFQAGSIGDSYDDPANTSRYDVIFDGAQARYRDQDKSLKLTFDSNDGSDCGGDHFYGFTQDLPAEVGHGSSVWFRAYFFFPSAMSWGYVNPGCEPPIYDDGFGASKFLVLSQTGHESPRMYMQPSAGHQSVGYEPGWIVNHDGLGEYCNDAPWTRASVPLDRWVALQMQWTLSSDGPGSVRFWIDETFVGDCVSPDGNIPEGYQCGNWGIGDYWNGLHFTDNQPGRDAFWMAEVIVAADLPGYGAPDALDSGGRPYISPTTRVSQFR